MNYSIRGVALFLALCTGASMSVCTSAQTSDAPHDKLVAVAPSAGASQPTFPLSIDTRGTRTHPLVFESIESSEDKQDRQTAALTRERDSANSRWVMLLTAGMLAVAAIQAYFFLIQLRLMRRSMAVAELAADSAAKSVETMRDSSERQLRAYIAVDRAWIEFNEEGGPEVTIVIRNSGVTPAHELKHWINLTIQRYPLQVELKRPPEDFVMASSVLGAGATHNMVKGSPGLSIPVPLRNQIGTAAGTVYVYGEVTYKDVFGTPQHLRYRLMHGGAKPAVPRLLTPCEEGNEAT